MRMYQLSHLIIERLPSVHDYFEQLDVKPVRKCANERGREGVSEVVSE